MKASERDENGEGKSVERFLDVGVQPENVASTMRKGVTLSEKWRTCSKSPRKRSRRGRRGSQSKEFGEG